MIRYVKGDATRPQGNGPKIIAHVCNDMGAWGAGFVLALSKRWPEPEEAYRRLGNMRTLGHVQLVDVYKNEKRGVIWPIFVANMIAQTLGGTRPLRDDALRACLLNVAESCRAMSASLHMPRIGCGLAGGKWEEVGPIVEETCRDISVTVYDLP